MSKKKCLFKSDDPDFWNVWTGERQRTVNWETIAADWQGELHREPAWDSDTADMSQQ